MFLKNTVYFSFALFIAALVCSCKKAPNYPVEPSIAFKDLRVVKYFVSPSAPADSIYIRFNFKDGDGDLGNDPSPGNPLDLFIELYKKTNGVYVSINKFLPNYNSTLPLLSPYTATGPIDGTITYKVDPFRKGIPLRDTANPYPALFMQYDTLQFRIRIKDRANHYSEWIQTTDYIVWKDL